MDAGGDTTGIGGKKGPTGPFGLPHPPGEGKKNSKTSILKPKLKYKSGVIRRRPDPVQNPSLDGLRSPWVPAPGKSTVSNSHLTRQPLEESLNGTSSSSLISHRYHATEDSKLKRSNVKTGSAKINIIGTIGSRGLRKAGSKLKKIRASGYTLKTKDSLVDVTAFLQSKRQDIMKLWEEYLPDADTTLIRQFESANSLAIDAAQEVDNLRKSIQELHQKESSLSEGDCETLDRLRTQVLSKVKAFEEVNSQVHMMISKKFESKSTETTNEPPEGSARASESTSRPILGVRGGVSFGPHEVIVLKDKSQYFQNTYDSDQEWPLGIDDRLPGRHGPFSITTGTNSKTASTKTSATTDLNKLSQLYGERYELPSVQDSLHRASTGFIKESRVRFEEEGHRRNPSVGDEGHTDLYREKVNAVQRKLMETEAEMEELKGDLQRVESDSNFQVRMLKSSFKDRIETLESFPEYLQLTEKRLLETMQGKVQLERILQDKEREVSNLKESGDQCWREAESLKDQLRAALHSKDLLGVRMTEFEKSNDLLRKELDEKRNEVEKLTTRLELTSMSSTDLQSKGQGQEVAHLSLQNQRLELKYGDLKDRLDKAHTEIHILQIAKKKLSIRLARRQEEILQELEEARGRNRLLQSQIHYIRTTYHDLFPIELFHPSSLVSKKPEAQERSRSRSVIVQSKTDPVDSPEMISKIGQKSWDSSTRGDFEFFGSEEDN